MGYIIIILLIINLVFLSLLAETGQQEQAIRVLLEEQEDRIVLTQLD